MLISQNQGGKAAKATKPKTRKGKHEQQLAVIGANLLVHAARLKTAIAGAQKIDGGGVVLVEEAVQELSEDLFGCGETLIEAISKREMAFEKETGNDRTGNS